MGGYHIGLVLGHFGLCWDILGHVGTILGSSWAILGSFRICVGLCFGLGHVSVVDFSPMQGVCKKHQKYQEKIQFVDYVADGFCFYFFGCFCFFFGACCSHVGPFWAIFGSVSAFVLDSGMSASLTFRPCKACAKNTKNIADGFCCYFFGCFCFFLQACCC